MRHLWITAINRAEELHDPSCYHGRKWSEITDHQRADAILACYERLTNKGFV